MMMLIRKPKLWLEAGVGITLKGHPKGLSSASQAFFPIDFTNF